jgi:hypothetical protein
VMVFIARYTSWLGRTFEASKRCEAAQLLGKAEGLAEGARDGRVQGNCGRDAECKDGERHSELR